MGFTYGSVLKKKVKVTLVQALRFCTGRTVYRGSRGITLLFKATELEGDEGTASRCGRFLPPPQGKTRYSLYRRLVGPQDRSGQVRKISPTPGFDPRTVQTRSSVAILTELPGPTLYCLPIVKYNCKSFLLIQSKFIGFLTCNPKLKIAVISVNDCVCFRLFPSFSPVSTFGHRFNLLKPTGHVMHHQQFNIQQLYALPKLYLCVLYLSENKQRLVPLTA